MKIGWLRLTMGIEIDFNTAHIGYSEMRTGWLMALVKAGHKIKILTTLTKESEDTYTKLINNTYEKKNENEWDVNWIKGNVEYEPVGFADDCDLLIVENSAVNWMYGCPCTNKPQIRRCVEIIDSYKGIVIVEQSDPDLPFPFWKIAKAKKDWKVKDNPYKLGITKDVEGLEDYGWGTEKELFANKKYVVIVKSNDTDQVLDTMDGTRYGYKRLVEEKLIEVKYIGQAYSYEHVNHLKFNDDSKYDLFYAGYPRNREERFEELMMNNQPWLRMAVCGPWQKTKNEDMAKRLPYHFIENLGMIKSWREMLSIINSSKASLYLAVKRSMKMGWETSRPMEALFCGNIVLCDTNIKNFDNLIDKEFGVSYQNKEKMYKWLVSLDNEERGYIWQYQFDQVKNRTWNWFVDELGKILLEKGIDLKGVQENVPDDYRLHTNYTIDKEKIGTGELTQLQIDHGNINREKWQVWIRENTQKFKCFLTFDNSSACMYCAWRKWCEPLTDHFEKLKKGEIFVVEKKEETIAREVRQETTEVEKKEEVKDNNVKITIEKFDNKKVVNIVIPAL